jgi:hypothetical protein
MTVAANSGADASGVDVPRCSFRMEMVAQAGELDVEEFRKTFSPSTTRF